MSIISLMNNHIFYAHICIAHNIYSQIQYLAQTTMSFQLALCELSQNCNHLKVIAQNIDTKVDDIYLLKAFIKLYRNRKACNDYGGDKRHWIHVIWSTRALWVSNMLFRRIFEEEPWWGQDDWQFHLADCCFDLNWFVWGRKIHPFHFLNLWTNPIEIVGSHVLPEGPARFTTLLKSVTSLLSEVELNFDQL